MAGSEVLVVAPGDDLHALTVRHQIERRSLAKVHILDPATFPIASRTAWSFGDRFHLELDLSDALGQPLSPRTTEVLATRKAHVRIDASDVGGVWLRRWRSPLPHAEIASTSLREYCIRTVHDDLISALSVLPVHNAYWAEEQMASKRYQLLLAGRSGLPVPRTLITSDPARARAFVIAARSNAIEVVCKQASDETAFALPTRIIEEVDFNRLDSLRFAPATFQHRVRGVDLRVVILDETIYCCSCPSNDVELVDIRVDRTARMQPAEFPEPFKSSLLRFHRDSGLTFGAYDFKLDCSGVPYFLEVNVSGQWLDLEVDGGHPISAHWAEILTGSEGRDLQPLSYAETERLRSTEDPVGALVWTSVL